MIELIAASGERGPLIRLTPRTGHKKLAPTLEFPLKYGHRCPTCSNLICAVFYPDRKIDLFPYEETIVLSQGEKNAGEVLKVVPGTLPEESNLKVDFFATDNGSVQHIRQKNHLIRIGAVQDRGYNGEGIEEVGERPCFDTALFHPREDLLIKDLLLLFQAYTPKDLSGFNLPTVQQLFPDKNGDRTTDRKFRWIEAVGNAPPAILMDRGFVKSAYNFWLKQRMDTFRKPAPTTA